MSHFLAWEALDILQQPVGGHGAEDGLAWFYSQCGVYSVKFV